VEDGLGLALTLSEAAPLTVQAGTPAEETPPTALAAGPEAAPMGGAEFTGAGVENLARSFPEEPSHGLATLALSALPPASSGTAALLAGSVGSSLQAPGSVLSWAVPDNGDSQEHQGSGGEILWAGLGDDIRIGATGRDFLLGGIDSAAADPSDYARTHEAAALDAHEAALCYLVAEWSAAEGQETLARGRTEDVFLRAAEDTGALLAGGLFRWDGGPSQAAASGTALAGELGWGGEGS
jgi:hypothetical protein